MLDKDTPIDHPDLEPIWRAAQDHDLPVVHHSNTWNPPYFPGYENLWDNIFLGRLASHPWGGMRFMAAFIGAGILDRYPSLRMGVLECGFGWLPFWAKRMDEQAVYVGGVAALKQPPSAYMTSGRFFCTIETSKYQLCTGFLRRAIASIARALNVTGDSPGGQLKPFCVQL